MEQQQLPASASKSKKRKNFMWSLRPEWITSLLQIMGDFVDANMRSANGFKDSVYQSAAIKIKEKFGIEVTGEQCKNQIRYQRNIWSRIQELKKKSGVSWDEEKKMIVMGSEEYASHIQEFPKDAIYLNVPIQNYVELEKVCGEGHATGDWAKSSSSQSSFGIPHINLQDDFTPLSEDDVEEIVGASVGASKEKISPPLQENPPKKKTKVKSIDQIITEYISIMAESVSEVATAIKSSIKYNADKNMFAELMTELSIILGFSEDEIDKIYGNFVSNPSIIASFISIPREAKARWMRKLLEK